MFKRFFSRRRQKSSLLTQTGWHLKKFAQQKAKTLAQLLQTRSQRMSTRELKWWLAGFCGMGVLACILLLFTTLSGSSTAAPQPAPGWHRTVRTGIPQRNNTSDFRNYQQIIRLEQYLDSLQKEAPRTKQSTLS